MSSLLRPHDHGATHHGSGSALRADPCPATAACARQLLNSHPAPLSYDLLELHPDRLAPACSRAPRHSSSSSLLPTPANLLRTTPKHSAHRTNRIEAAQRTPSGTARQLHLPARAH